MVIWSDLMISLPSAATDYDYDDGDDDDAQVIYVLSTVQSFHR